MPSLQQSAAAAAAVTLYMRRRSWCTVPLSFSQGHAGIGESVLIVLLTISVSLVAVLSAIGISERSIIENFDGGIYNLLSHVLGARVGATVAIIYCFGQVVFFSVVARDASYICVFFSRMQSTDGETAIDLCSIKNLCSSLKALIGI
jgi:uncharacterized membrane protein YhfC